VRGKAENAKVNRGAAAGQKSHADRVQRDDDRKHKGPIYGFAADPTGELASLNEGKK
jgi:hypothetical protein